MRKFYLSPSQYNKWEYQQRENKKECCWCEYMCDGVLEGTNRIWDIFEKRIDYDDE